MLLQLSPRRRCALIRVYAIDQTRQIEPAIKGVSQQQFNDLDLPNMQRALQQLLCRQWHPPAIVGRSRQRPIVVDALEANPWYARRRTISTGDFSVDTAEYGLQ